MSSAILAAVVVLLVIAAIYGSYLLVRGPVANAGDEPSPIVWAKEIPPEKWVAPAREATSSRGRDARRSARKAAKAARRRN